MTFSRTDRQLVPDRFAKVFEDPRLARLVIGVQAAEEDLNPPSTHWRDDMVASIIIWS
jgi:hypothetical protein